MFKLSLRRKQSKPSPRQPSHSTHRDKLQAVSPEAVGRFFRSPEWALVTEILAEELDAAEVKLVNCDANDAAQVGRIQATIKCLRWFVCGECREQVTDRVTKEEKEKQDGTER